MRLIDADDFKEKIKCVCDAGGWLEPVTTAIKEYICKQVDYQTTVDAVEVVRCKDCKYFELNHWDGLIITAHEICSKWADGCKTNKDGYCFLGERKTDG